MGALDQIVQALDFALKVATIFGVIWLAVKQRIKANKDELDVQSKEIAALTLEVSKHTVQLEYMPTHDDLAGIHRRLNDVKDVVASTNSAVAGLTASVEAMAGQVKLMNEYHLPPGGGSS